MQIYSYLCPNEVRRFQLFSKRIFNFITSSRMDQGWTWQAFAARGLRALRAWTGDLIIYLGQPLYEDSVKCPRCNNWIQTKNKARHQQSMVCHDGQIQQAVNWAMGAPQLNNQWWKSQECQFLKYNSNKTSRIFISRIFKQLLSSKLTYKQRTSNCWWHMNF